MSGLHFMGEVPVHHGCTSTAPCATRSIARCPSRSATGSIRSRWSSDTAPTRCATRWCRACRSAPTSSSIPTTSRPRSARAATSPTSCGTPAASSCPTWTARPARSRGRAANVVRRDELTLADRWIIARCDATVREATEAYERFRLNEAAAAVYRFIWSDLADWYIEQIKPRLYGDVPGGDVARAVAAQTFDVALRLLHPVMPFVTEALWQRFPGRPAEASISVAPWPRPDPRAEDAGRPARVRAGPGGRRRHPRHPRRVRRAAGPGGAGGRQPGRSGARRRDSSAERRR